MEYVQARIPTLHDLTGRVPDAPLSATAVVVPMAGTDYRHDATEQILDTLAELEPAAVVVPLRADPAVVPEVASTLNALDCPTELLWCNAPEIERRLDDAGLSGSTGKGHDVWLALGRASSIADYVVVHDADIEGYDGSRVARLCAPLADGRSFTKGYYARVEDNALYGRLLRLFYEPIVRALAAGHDDPYLAYLNAFRYALAGDIGMTASFARTVRVERSWGLEVGMLGEAFRAAGVDGTAQVDLGVHQHDHRPVEGAAGLATMAQTVGGALFRTLEDNDIDPNYEQLPARYREEAAQLIDQYAADAAFNGLDYDQESEQEQVEAYADAIAPPATDDRLPAWSNTDLDPDELAACSTASLPAPTTN